MPRAIPLFVLAAILVGLAAFVRKANSAQPINRTFALYTVLMALWVCGIAGLHTGANLEAWGRFTFACASLLPAAFLLFARVYPTPTEWPSRPLLQITCGIGALLAVASLLTPLVLYDVRLTSVGLTRRPGPLYPVFAVYFLLAWGLALGLLVAKWRKASGLPKAHLHNLGLGLLISGVGGITTNLLLPLLLGNSSYTWIGPYFILALLALVAHAIIRHRLMNMRLFVRRGFTYLLAATIAGAVFALVLVVLDTLSGAPPGHAALAFQLAVALLIAFLFHPLKRLIQASLDRYVYRASYDYQQVLREATTRIPSTLDLGTLLNHLCEVIVRTIRPDFVAVFVRDTSTPQFVMSAHNTIDHYPAQFLPDILETAPLPAFLSVSRRPLLRDDLRHPTRHNAAAPAVEHLSRLQADCALPVFLEKTLTGFFILGAKRSGDPFFSEDIELLSTLSNQAAIAIQNARLYLQVTLTNEYVGNIINNMDSGVITIDALGKVTVCNATAERLCGIPRSLLVSQTADTLPASIGAELQATLRDGQPRPQTETLLPGADDRLTPIVCSTSALRNAEGVILGALVVFSDLSKIKALETEKRRAQRLAALGAVASGIAHEIKNPLVAIRTFAELLPDRFHEEEFRGDFSRVVAGEIDRLDDLVARLRGIAASARPATQPVDIRAPIADTLSLLRGQLDQTKTTVHRQFEDPAPNVLVDDSQLRQLFLNLFQNGMDAMGSSGHLTIRIKRKDRQGSSWIVTEVSDTGPGIPEDSRSQIFDPFFTTKAKGLGLGLAICRSITDAHKGILRVEQGADAQGTTFVVELPAVDSISTLELVQRDG